MTESNTIPTLYLKDEVDLNNLVILKNNILEWNEIKSKIIIRFTINIYEFLY